MDEVTQPNPARRDPDGAVRADGRLLALASKHHGVLTLTQVKSCGLTPSAITRRTEATTLFRTHRGVYSVVPERLLAQEGRLRAALLGSGDAAALAGFVASERHLLMAGESRRIDIVTPKHCVGPSGVEVHWTRQLPDDDVVVIRGLRTTSVSRTLVDMAGLVGRQRLESLCEQAARRRVFDEDAIRDVLARSRGRRGAAAMRDLLGEYDVGRTRTRSELERALRRLVTRFGVAVPEYNVAFTCPVMGTIIVDALWADLGFGVELDGRESHDTTPAFFRDRDKGLSLREQGVEVMRLTWRQVTREDARIARVLIAVVGRAN